MRGLFLPWPLVVSLLLAVCAAVGVPVLGWRRAGVSGDVDTLLTNLTGLL